MSSSVAFNTDGSYTITYLDDAGALVSSETHNHP